MEKHKLEGLVPLGPTLGTLPQLGEDVRSGITANVNGVEVTIKFGSDSPLGYTVMPTTLSVTVGCSGDGDIASRRRAFDLLLEVTRNALNMIRVTQPMTGLPGTLPAFSNVLFHSDGKVEPLGFDWRDGHRPVATIISRPELQPHAADFERAIQGELNDDWDLDILIGQATHYARDNWDSNPSLSLVLAALVMETKMKRVLRRDTPADMQEDLLLEVPLERPLKKTVESLFSSQTKMFLGRRSLREERPHLWPEVLKIFKARNDFAHQAINVSRDDAIKAVTCARRVMLWADDKSPQNYPH